MKKLEVYGIRWRLYSVHLSADFGFDKTLTTWLVGSGNCSLVCFLEALIGFCSMRQYADAWQRNNEVLPIKGDWTLFLFECKLSWFCFPCQSTPDSMCFIIFWFLFALLFFALSCLCSVCLFWFFSRFLHIIFLKHFRSKQNDFVKWGPQTILVKNAKTVVSIGSNLKLLGLQNHAKPTMMLWRVLIPCQLMHSLAPHVPERLQESVLPCLESGQMKNKEDFVLVPDSHGYFWRKFVHIFSAFDVRAENRTWPGEKHISIVVESRYDTGFKAWCCIVFWVCWKLKRFCAILCNDYSQGKLNNDPFPILNLLWHFDLPSSAFGKIILYFFGSICRASAQWVSWIQCAG